MGCLTEDKESKSKMRYVMSKSGLIAYDKETPITLRFDHEETSQLTGKNLDYSKYDDYCEVAHLEISNRCNLRCKYCYVPDKKGLELDTESWKRIIKNLAESGIFQVSFGGGEPTLRSDLLELARFVVSCGLNLGMTTNGIELVKLDPVRLKKYFRQINISWHENPEVVEKALKFLYDNDIPRGINYCYSKLSYKDNDVIKFLTEMFHAELLYLVYKPVIKDKRNQIPNTEVLRIAQQSSDEGLRVAVDGPCVNKCLMKRKFVDVDHLGNTFPCSFVREPMGNLLEESFKNIWKKRGEQIKCPYVKMEVGNK
jgi:MoaA/NifB/PqqE/SkfB family radical SAM enzyme